VDSQIWCRIKHNVTVRGQVEHKGHVFTTDVNLIHSIFSLGGYSGLPVLAGSAQPHRWRSGLCILKRNSYAASWLSSGRIAASTETVLFQFVTLHPRVSRDVPLTNLGRCTLLCRVVAVSSFLARLHDSDAES